MATAPRDGDVITAADVAVCPSSCAVCLQPCDDEQEVERLRCCHAFHKKCITQWLAHKPTCPTCRCGLDGKMENGASLARAPVIVEPASFQAHEVQQFSRDGGDEFGTVFDWEHGQYDQQQLLRQLVQAAFHDDSAMHRSNWQAYDAGWAAVAAGSSASPRSPPPPLSRRRWTRLPLALRALRIWRPHSARRHDGGGAFGSERVVEPAIAAPAQSHIAPTATTPAAPRPPDIVVDGGSSCGDLAVPSATSAPCSADLEGAVAPHATVLVVPDGHAHWF